MPTVAQVSPAPTKLRTLSPGESAGLARAGTQAAAENAPGASIAAAVRDSQKIGMDILPALREGRWGDAAKAWVGSTAAALSAIPGVHALPVFGGVIAGMNAATADREALAAARKMEEAGHGPEAIWSTTGWFKGPEGKWKFEIDDSKARIGQKAQEDIAERGTTGESPAAAVLWHKSLYEAYPDLRRVTAEIKQGSYTGGGGSYDATKDHIEVDVAGGDAARRSVMLHEMQHAVQVREGFAPGSNPDPREAMRDHPELMTELTMGRLGGRQAADYGEHEYRDMVAKAGRLAAETIYRRSAGEVEARAVERRADMTPEERRLGSPLLSYDVPLDKLILPSAAEKAAASLDILSHPAAWNKPR